MYTAKQVRKHERVLFGWSSSRGCTARTHAFDVHNDRLMTEVLEKAREAATERHIRTLVLLQAKALDALHLSEGDMLTTTDIVRRLEVGMKLKRIVRGTDSPAEASKLAYQVLWSDSAALSSRPKPPGRVRHQRSTSQRASNQSAAG